MNRLPKTKDKGFTLTEIVVVIVLVGLVALLAASVVLILTNERNRQIIDDNQASEILLIEEQFKSKLSVSDTQGVTLVVYQNKIQAQSQTGNIILLDFTQSPFTINNTNLTATSINFDVASDNIIRLRATIGNYTYTSLYLVRAAGLLAGDTNE